MEAGWSARRVTRQLDHSDCVVMEVLRLVDPRCAICTNTRLSTLSTHQSSRRPPHWASVSSRTIRGCLAEGHLRSRPPLHVLPLTPTHRRLRLEWCRARRNWTASEWNQVVFSDESRFNLSSDDNRFRVWRPRGERLNPLFALQRHTARRAGVMVWGAIAYTTRSPLVLIRGTMAFQRYAHDIL
ncbi:transposable element Tcb1 transposase [Trichonephila clavipes]|nr:transposable element Tcb1 transposase [Trichonephila clavipes]